jgi:hypothetical protein
MRVRADARELVRWARDRGWEVEPTNGNHLRFSKDGVERPVFAGQRLGDPRAVRNAKAQLLRSERNDV